MDEVTNTMNEMKETVDSTGEVSPAVIPNEPKPAGLTLDLSKLSRKKITVDLGTEQRDLYLDVSDLNILVRLKTLLPELQKFQAESTKRLAGIKPEGDEDSLKNVGEMLSELDTKMREIMDTIFDANVSEVCAPSGNMFDFIDGRARYEIIFDGLVSLFDSNISAEAKKLEKRVNGNKHTSKYIK